MMETTNITTVQTMEIPMRAGMVRPCLRPMMIPQAVPPIAALISATAGEKLSSDALPASACLARQADNIVKTGGAVSASQNQSHLIFAGASFGTVSGSFSVSSPPQKLQVLAG